MPDTKREVGRPWLRVHAIGVFLALLAGVHKFVIAAVPINDDFMHLAYSRQLLAGEWPVRDFFDYGMGLMYGLSALAQLVFGYRLLGEAVIDGTAAALSTFLVYSLVRKTSGSLAAGLVSALLVLVATPRGYAYPKLIVYAVAAQAWWWYVRQPERRKAVALGVLTAVAFFVRHDHGVYVACGVGLAMVAAHGFSRALAGPLALAGSVALGLVAPFLVYASVESGGFANVVRTEVAAVTGEHHDAHVGPRWPIRTVSGLVRVEPADAYAPLIGIRWKAVSSQADRRAFVERYGLAATQTDDPQTVRIRLSAHGIDRLRDLLAEPVVDDTAGIDRSRTAIEYEAWPMWDRARFRVGLLRVQLFPGFDTTARAGEAAVVLLYAVSLLALAASLPWLRDWFPAGVGGLPLACFALFTLVVSYGLIRTPYDTRVADGIILPSILLGLLVAVPLRMREQGRRWSRWVPVTVAALVLTVMTLEGLAVAGPFSERINWVAGDWRSMRRAGGAWGEVRQRLWTSPPVDFWKGSGAPAAIELARYARACVAPSERILVLWFAPEIHFFADRLMAGRHLYFLPTFGDLAHEQRLEMEKVLRTSPPIVFANGSFDGSTRIAFPGVVDYISREYEQGGVLDDDGERYRILVRPGRTPVRMYGEHAWPCYLPGPDVAATP